MPKPLPPPGKVAPVISIGCGLNSSVGPATFVTICSFVLNRAKLPSCPMPPKFAGNKERANWTAFVKVGAHTAQMAMKILALTNLYPPHYLGGYELIAYAVLNNLRRRGHSVEILTSNYIVPVKE